jgi:hypothetical protein
LLQRFACEAATADCLCQAPVDAMFRPASRADVAQLVEQRFRKPQVTGSNPVVGSVNYQLHNRIISVEASGLSIEPSENPA